MGKLKTELSEVIYNAASQAFEAKVTVHQANGPVTYACELAAPITMSFEDASIGLVDQALSRHGAPTALRSYRKAVKPAAPIKLAVAKLRRGLPLGQYGFFRGRAA